MEYLKNSQPDAFDNEEIWQIVIEEIKRLNVIVFYDFRLLDIKYEEQKEGGSPVIDHIKII